MAELPKFQQVQYQLSAHIRDPKTVPGPPGIEDRRINIYRELFYNNIEGFLQRTFPVMHKLLDGPAWHSLVRDFFSRHQSHSPYFLEIPKEFLEFLEQERNAPGDPPFLLELAHYEWVELAVSILEDDINAIPADRDGDLMDGIPLLSPTAWSLAYQYPVHQISPTHQPTEPGEMHTFIVVYRDRFDKVGFIDINPVTARLIELLQSNADRSPKQTGRAMLGQIAKEIQHPNPQLVIDGGLEILQNLKDHDIVLGTQV